MRESRVRSREDAGRQGDAGGRGQGDGKEVGSKGTQGGDGREERIGERGGGRYYRHQTS